MTKTEFARVTASYALLVAAAVLCGVAAMDVIFALSGSDLAVGLMQGLATAIAGLAVGIASHAIAPKPES